MRRISPFGRAFALAFVFAATSPLAATIFSEDFQTSIDPDSGLPVVRCTGPGGPGTYPFPSGFFLRNVDNRAPAANVAYVNQAWEVREDFQLDNDNCVAFSTSWYVPAGAANDWMWTPLIGPLPADPMVLSWRARTYDPAYQDGYEVRIMTVPPTGGTGVVGNQLTSSTVLFSTAAESSDWTTRTVALDAYAGQSVYIGFRNNTTDRFLLVIDDIRLDTILPFDPQLVSAVDVQTQGYAKLPVELNYGFDLQAQVRNNGTGALTSVTVEADLLVDGLPADVLASAPIAVLAPSTSQTLTVGSSSYSQIGHWSVDALVGAAEGDLVPDNSVLARELVEVTADELTRAEGNPTGAMGIGMGNGGELGSDFEIPLAATLHKVSVGMNNVDELPDTDPPGDGVGDFNGYTLSVLLRSWNTPANEPGAVLATSTVDVPANAPIGAMTLEFDFDEILPPGRYLLSVVEPTLPAPLTLSLHTTQERFTPGTVWIDWPTSPAASWSNLEDFGPQFELTPAISAFLRLPVLTPGAEDDLFEVPQSGNFAGDVSSNDLPSDATDNVWSVTTPPQTGVVTMQASGAFEYMPAADAAGTSDFFGYTLCDSDNDCSSATVELQIQVNLPEAADDSFSVPQTGLFAGNVAGNDTPTDDGGNVWTVTTAPALGLLSMAPSGAFEFTPDPSQVGTTVTFEYMLCDADTDCDSATVELQIQVNRPIAVNDFFEVPPDGTFAGDVSLNDTPSDDGGNLWSVFEQPASGTVVMQSNGAFQFTPAPGSAGELVTFDYTACDDDEDCATATVQLDIQVTTPVAADDAFEVFPIGEFAGDVSLNDTPSDDGGNLWSVAAQPASGLLTMQPSGAFEYTPAAGADGSTVVFDYSLCDAGNDCDTATVELQIMPAGIFADSFESPP
jgi:hypothetical protein